MISWTPEPEELEFHFRRFRRLRQYFPLVVDVSHWWLNVLDDFFGHFSDAKAVGVYRDLESCTKSFMKIKGFGRGKQLRVPTANLKCDDQLIPADGVYAGRCTVDSATYPVALSIGSSWITKLYAAHFSCATPWPGGYNDTVQFKVRYGTHGLHYFP